MFHEFELQSVGWMIGKFVNKVIKIPTSLDTVNYCSQNSADVLLSKRTVSSWAVMNLGLVRVREIRLVATSSRKSSEIIYAITLGLPPAISSELTRVKASRSFRATVLLVSTMEHFNDFMPASYSSVVVSGCRYEIRAYK